MLSPGNRTAARISLAVIIGMIVLKVAVGVVTSSISVLAQTADSFFDLSAVFISFVLVRTISKPADAEHPFGHGKFENVASTVQSLVIFIIGIVVIYFSITEIVGGATLRYAEAGMAVMVLSILVSVFLSRYMLRVARETGSAALTVNALSISTVKYTASAVLVGLIIARITGWNIIDPIVALLISLWILKEGVDVLRKSSPALIDEKLPLNEEAIISSTIMEHCSQLVGFHNLRTRKSGSQRYVDLHLVVPRNTSVANAHKITEHLEQDIRRKLPHTSMIIHIEPCEGNCTECAVPCNLKK
jgi:cation diffusion facilitator family transporter